MGRGASGADDARGRIFAAASSSRRPDLRVIGVTQARHVVRGTPLFLKAPTFVRLASLRPSLVLFAFCLAQIVAWTFAPAWTHDAPPLDVVESGMWGREWVLATYKHPAAPSWALELTRLATGAIGWPAYLVSQFCVTATFVLVWRLGLDLFGEDDEGQGRALAGVLLLAGLFYFSWPTPEFNHNVAQLPVYAAIAWLTWRATTRGTWGWWAGLGLVCGAGLHVKYSVAVVVAISAVWILFDGGFLRRLATPGPWIALALAALVAAPQVWWLVGHDYMPFVYARSRAGHALSSRPLASLGAILAAHAGLFVLAAIAGLFGRGARPGMLLARRQMRFLLLFALGPVMATLAMTALLSMGTRDMWFMPMADLSGLLVVGLTAMRWTPARLRRLTGAAFALVAILPTAYAVTVDYQPRLTGVLLRAAWPQRAISQRMQEVWRDRTGAPLRIVAGDQWIAGLVGLSAPDAPSILTNGDPTISPWIDAARLRREGALLVWTTEFKAPRMVELAAGLSEGEEDFAVPGLPKLPPVRVHYAVLPPNAFRSP